MWTWYCTLFHYPSSETFVFHLQPKMERKGTEKFWAPHSMEERHWIAGACPKKSNEVGEGSRAQFLWGAAGETSCLAWMLTFGTVAVQLHLIIFLCSVPCRKVYTWRGLCRSLINFNVCGCTGVCFLNSLFPLTSFFSSLLVYNTDTGKSEEVCVDAEVDAVLTHWDFHF